MSSRINRLLLLGWIATAAFVYCVIGLAAVDVETSRYGIALVLPTALVVARAACLAASGRVWSDVVAVGSTTILTAWLIATYQLFFVYIQTTGGKPDTFRTGPVEPRAATVSLIDRYSPGSDPIVVAASDFWNDYTLRYLFMNDRRVTVRSLFEAIHDPKLIDRSSRAGRLWFVEFSNSSYLPDIRRMRSVGVHERQIMVVDYAGQPILTVINAHVSTVSNHASPHQ